MEDVWAMRESGLGMMELSRGEWEGIMKGTGGGFSVYLRVQQGKDVKEQEEEKERLRQLGEGLRVGDETIGSEEDDEKNEEGKWRGRTRRKRGTRTFSLPVPWR